MKLVSKMTDIHGISLIIWQDKSWNRTTMSNDRAVQLTTAKVYVFSDPVLCMGRVPNTPVSAWKEQLEWFMNSSQYREFDRIDGEPMEFEWTNFPGFSTLQILAEIEKMMTETECEPEQFTGRSIVMSIYNDIVWRERGNKDMCIANSKIVAECAKRFAHGHWSFLGRGPEKKWYGTHTYKLNAKWDRVAEDMMLNYSESGQTPYSVDLVLWNEELCEAKKRCNCLFISPLKWFFERSSPSISSVSTEQWRTCATAWLVESLVVQNEQGNLFLRIIRKLRLFPQNWLQRNKSPRIDGNIQGNLLQDYEATNRKSSTSSSIDQTMLQCR